MLQGRVQLQIHALLVHCPLAIFAFRLIARDEDPSSTRPKWHFGCLSSSTQGCSFRRFVYRCSCRYTITTEEGALQPIARVLTTVGAELLVTYFVTS